MLEQLGLVDGVVTDDSDTLVFGARRVYRNMFERRRFVELFSSDVIAAELGLTRERLACLALLLGSDYTPGVRGIGKVNAIEVISAFPGLAGLRQFRDWVFSGSAEPRPAVPAGIRSGDPAARVAALREYKQRLFKYKHSSLRAGWGISPAFPDKAVYDAYLRPRADRSPEPFAWAKPDYAGVERFMQARLGWDVGSCRRLLDPVEQALETGPGASAVAQSRLLAYFGPTGRFTNVEDGTASARIRSAVRALAMQDEPEEGGAGVAATAGNTAAPAASAAAPLAAASDSAGRDPARPSPPVLSDSEALDALDGEDGVMAAASVAEADAVAAALAEEAEEQVHALAAIAGDGDDDVVLAVEAMPGAGSAAVAAPAAVGGAAATSSGGLAPVVVGGRLGLSAREAAILELQALFGDELGGGDGDGASDVDGDDLGADARDPVAPRKAPRKKLQPENSSRSGAQAAGGIKRKAVRKPEAPPSVDVGAHGAVSASAPGAERKRKPKRAKPDRDAAAST